MSGSDRVFLTRDQAKELIHINDGSGHMLTQTTFGLMGCDISEADIDAALDDAQLIEVGGPVCVRMKHGVSITPKGAEVQGDLMFLQHKDGALDKYLEEESR